jgi:hypothetical protein
LNKYKLDKISLDKQDLIDEAFMLYQSISNLGISHVGKSHKRQNSAIAILLNKCDNNYSWIVYILHLGNGLGFLWHWSTQFTQMQIE